MNKSDLEILADLRLAEAKALLDSGYFCGSYYLAGYSVECAIKVCIAKQVREFDFPDKKLAEKSHQHDLGALIKVAALSTSLAQYEDASSDFKANWAVIKDWKVESRYDGRISEFDARNLLDAISDPTAGIMKWLKTFW